MTAEMSPGYTTCTRYRCKAFCPFTRVIAPQRGAHTVGSRAIERHILSGVVCAVYPVYHLARHRARVLLRVAARDHECGRAHRAFTCVAKAIAGAVP